MRVIWKKVWRDIWNHKSRSSLVVLSIAVGVFSIGLTIGILEILQGRMTSTWQASNPSNILIGMGAGATDDVVHFINAMPELEGADATFSTGIRWKSQIEQPWDSATITARADYDNQVYDKLNLEEGTWPVRGNIVVERGSASRFDIGMGDTVYLEASGRPRAVQVVGIVYDALIVPPIFTNEASFYTTRRDMERLGGPTDFTHLKATISDYTEERARAAAIEVTDRLEKLNIEHGTPQFFDPDRHFFQDIVDGLVLILIVMSFLALGLSMLLVINTVTAVVTEQVPQIGIMKSLGATSGRIFIIYLSGVVIYIAIALLFAVPLGMLTSFFVSAAGLELFNVNPGNFTISFNALLAQLGFGLIAPPIAALKPLITGASISVREAVSTYGIGERMGLIATGMARFRRIPRLVSLTVSNTFRRKWRLILTQVALIGGGSIFIMVMSVQSSLTTTFDLIQETYNFDIYVFFDRPQQITSVEAEVMRIPDVQSVEGFDILLETPVRRVDDPDGLDEESISLLAISKGGEGYRPQVREGRWLQSQDKNAVVLNQHIAEELGVGVGDEVIMELRADKESNWTIVGLSFDLNESQSASAAWLEEVSHEIGTSNTGIAVLVRTVPLDNDSLDVLSNVITDTLEARGRNVVISLTQDEWQSLLVATALVIVYLLMFLGVLIAIVGSIGLSGTLSINALERQREIAMMRAVGASGKAIAGMFIGEAIIIGVISWLIAIPISIPLGWVFANAVGDTILIQLLYHYSLLGVGLWLFLVILLAVLASGLPAWRAIRVSVREALAYE